MELEPILLRSQKKLRGIVSSRIKPAEETIKTILPVSSNIGITRLADITDMDILGIPNFSAVLPGTEDYIWVYSGKGPTRMDAKASALMESIERYSALPSGNRKKMVQGGYKEVSKVSKTLHPSNVVEPMILEYDDEMIMDFLSGYDLVNNEQILIPAPLALFRYSPKPPAINPFAYHHTNGLASGNVLEEAICHSLCEVIERDATSLAELNASALPYNTLRTMTKYLSDNGLEIDPVDGTEFVDDDSKYPDVDISNIDFKPISNLVKKFNDAKIPLIIKDITSPIGVPTFNASSIEWITEDYGYLAEGHGTHPDARIALLRAITEVSQTRAANIQGARDDLRKISYGNSNSDEKKTWQFMKSKNSIQFSEIKSYINDDILDDIKFILSRLISNGLKQVIVADLTNPQIMIPVVRTIVPGLETFKITKAVIGKRGRESFNL
ncbi:MAG TPA: YcaO-like family protein [Nitrososphaeraceae archaeon]|jgi:ribosomal protein S12 methylthiotransferase accessory factor